MRQSGVFLLLIVTANINLGSTGFGSAIRFVESVPSSEDIGALLKFTREIHEIFEFDKDDGHIFTAFTDAAAFLLAGIGESLTDKIERKLTEISTQFTDMIMKMDSDFNEIEKLMDDMSLFNQFNLKRYYITEEIQKVNGTLGDTLELLIGEMGRREQAMLAQKIIENGEGNVQTSLWRIHICLDSRNPMDFKTSFLDLMQQGVEDKRLELCGGGKSPNQYLYNLYEVLITTEIMGFMSLSYGYRKFNQLNANIHESSWQSFKSTETRFQLHFQRFKEAINSAPRDFRSCDPVSLERNETFIEMERLYQSVLISEAWAQRGMCKGTCDEIDLTDEQVTGTNCQRLNDCRPIVSPIACQSPRTQLRRYTWVGDDDGHSYGGTEKCDHLKANLERVTYKDFVNSDLSKCETCICICEANSIETMTSPELRGVHVISLEAARSSINNNMVITGLKFARQDGVILIQIKEGRLQSRGKIRPGTESWKNVPDTHVQVALSRVQKWNAEYKNEEKFIVIDEFHNAINLDDIVIPVGHVMTGIKFGISKKDNAANSKWKRIEIQVQYTPFNFTTGELLNRYEKSEWMSSEALHKEELTVNKNMDTPLNSKEPNLPNGDSNKFVKFVVSSFEKDLGQTTLPLWDAQPVESKPGSALAGVGLFHKGSPYFGGFLSFRLYSLNYADYMESNEIHGERATKRAPVSSNSYSSNYVYYGCRFLVALFIVLMVVVGHKYVHPTFAIPLPWKH